MGLEFVVGQITERRTTMAKKNKFPTELMIKQVTEGGLQYLAASVDPSELAGGAGEVVEVAVYRLVGMKKLTTQVKVETVG